LLEKAKIKIQSDLKSYPRNHRYMPKEIAKHEDRCAREYLWDDM
jgi:hypothetical protein